MDRADEHPWQVRSGTVHLRVRLTPKGGRDSIDGVVATPEGLAIQARVRAAPEDGAANAALEKLIARWLDLPRRHATLASGRKSRTKMVAISGDPRSVEPLLCAAVAGLEPQVKEPA